MIELQANVGKLRRHARISAAVHIGVVIVLLLAMGVTVAETSSRFQREKSWGTALVLLVAAGAAAYLVWHLVVAVRVSFGTRPRIVPYFQDKYFRSGSSRQTSEESKAAFRGGYAIAAEMPLLEALAGELGVMPLSAFGFGDDALGQQPQWSALSDGIRTASALAGSDRVGAATRSELQQLAAVLEKAAERQSKFALIVRHGPDDFISGVEMEKREGTFWC